jgi:hypothetical protein
MKFMETLMKTKTLFLFFSFLISLQMFVGCQGCVCPEDIKLGEVKMLNPTFFPYKGGEILQFINDKNETISLVDSSDKQYENKIVVESLCTKPPISSQISYYLGTPSYFLRYVNTNAKLRIDVSFRTWSTQQLPNDSVFYDNCTINVQDRQTRIGNNLNILVSDRGNSKLLGSNFLKRYEATKLVRDTIINKINYKNVYRDTQNSKVCYAEKIGIVSFFHNNQWWYLKL